MTGSGITGVEQRLQNAGECMGKNDETKRVLIVDDEEDMIWSLQKYLCNDTLQVEIVTASSGEEALQKMVDNRIDLVITDIKMPGMSGLDLLLEIKKKHSYTAVIVMTAFPSFEYKREAILSGSVHFVEKPFDINDLRSIVRKTMFEKSDFTGTMNGIGLIDIIQIKGLSNTTSALRVKNDDRQGIIYFEEGRVVHAICEDLEGEEAFYRILGFEGGEFESFNIGEKPEQTISLPNEVLLIEGTRKIDEARGLSEEGLVEEPEYDLDNMTFGEKVKDGKKSGIAIDGAIIANKENVEEDMDDVKGVLNEFTNIPGVNTACLVGRDGFLLESTALSGIDTEMIGAIASSGFGASESMGNQLGKGTLNMSMIEYMNGPVMLSPVGEEAFLVIVAEKEANLGMIRLKIKKHAREIQESAQI